MVACPLVIGVAGHALNLGPEIALAAVLAVSAPPSSGTAAVARMLGLDGAVPLVVTVLSMVLAPVTVPLLAGWFGGLEISALELALRLALLIGGAEGVAFLVRRHAAPVLAAHGGMVDGILLCRRQPPPRSGRRCEDLKDRSSLTAYCCKAGSSS